jgi:hypothetical protein
MSNQSQKDFEALASPKPGLEVTHVWRGVGSSIFLEMGKLTRRTRHDGSPSNGQGRIGRSISVKAETLVFEGRPNE